MWLSRYDPDYDAYHQLKDICPEGGWRIAQPRALSGIIPNTLLEKTSNVFIMASGDPTVSSVFVANSDRIDDNMVDQQPYIAVFDHRQGQAIGGFVQHGDWTGRSSALPSSTREAIAASGITAYFPLAQIPTALSGAIADLDIASQSGAWWNSLRLLDETR